MRPFLMLVLGALLSYAGYDAWGRFHALPDLVPSDKIAIYSPAEADITGIIKEMLKFYGLSCVNVQVGSYDDIKALNILDRLKSDGVTDGEDISIPFFNVNGKFVSEKKFLSTLKGMAIVDIRESPDPYIHVYGVEGCGFAQRGMRELDNNGLPYEFRDVNDPRYRGRFGALMQVSGVSSYEWPVIDVNGHVLINPAADEVKKYFNK